MSVTIADKLTSIAQNEQRVYQTGYDKGYEVGYDKGVVDGGGGTVVVNKPEVQGNYNITENGEYTYTPPSGKVFSSVNVAVNVPTESVGGEIEGKTNVTDKFSHSISSDGTTSGLLTFCHCPPTNEGGTTFTMMEFNSFGWVAFYASSGLIPGDVYDVYCVPLGELWETVLFANDDYSTLAIPSSNANIRQYARYYEDEGRLRVTIPPDFSGMLFINVKWTEGGCAIYKVEESEGGGTDDGSYDEGYNDGYTDGFEDGKAEGGDDTYYNEMWDEIQQDGTRTDYTRVFMGKGWNNVSFKPKHPIKPTKAQSMFERSGALSNEYVKSIDFSNCGVFVSCFATSEVTELGVIDCRRASAGWNGLMAMFAEATLLRKIEKLILPTDSGCSLDAFVHTDALEEITLEGTAHKSMNFQNSTKLNKASLTSIIYALSLTTSGLSITLSRAAVNKAFETSSGAADGSTSAEWTALVATKSNWTISLV